MAGHQQVARSLVQGDLGSSDNRDVVRGTRSGQTYYAGGNKADVELWGDDVSVSVGESASVKLHGK